MNREEILQEAVEGHNVTPEWVAMQTVKLYRSYTLQGLSHEDALKEARREIGIIKDEALNIRRRRNTWREHVAPWCVVVMGALAIWGWWRFFE